jgi:hypothetical protein
LRQLLCHQTHFPILLIPDPSPKSTVAAAAKYDNYCKDDDPGAVVVKDVA